MFPVFAKDVKEGDVVQTERGHRTISNVHVGRDLVFLDYENEGTKFAIKRKPLDGVTVIFRPYPKGMDQASMEDNASQIADGFVHAVTSEAKRQAARYALEAIQLYLMGLREPVQGTLFKPSPLPTAGGTCDSSVPVAGDRPSPYDLSDPRHPANRQRR